MYFAWLVGLGFVALIGSTIFHTFNYKRDFDIPAETVAETEAARCSSPTLRESNPSRTGPSRWLGLALTAPATRACFACGPPKAG